MYTTIKLIKKSNMICASLYKFEYPGRCQAFRSRHLMSKSQNKRQGAGACQTKRHTGKTKRNFHWISAK